MLAKKWSHLDAPPRLKFWRTRVAKATQEDAAIKIGIDLASYNAFERCRERPGVDIASRIETATGGFVKATHWAQRTP